MIAYLELEKKTLFLYLKIIAFKDNVLSIQVKEDTPASLRVRIPMSIIVLFIAVSVCMMVKTLNIQYHHQLFVVTLQHFACLVNKF